jgi:hypothetical protein
MIESELFQHDPALTGAVIGSAIGAALLVSAVLTKRWLDRPRRPRR